jgi:hypothetical protein
VIAEARSEHRNRTVLAIFVRRDVAADRDRRLVAPADIRRVGRVEGGFERMGDPRADRARATRVDPDVLFRDGSWNKTPIRASSV